MTECFLAGENLITALAGGVGAAKFLTGLVRVVREDDLTVVVNTGDDIELYGLHISPDLDIVAYTLAGIVDEEKGWGIRGDTFRCLEAIRRLDGEAWFSLGDSDFATHIIRTDLLKKGMRLSGVTALISKTLGLKVKILPMTDDRFETRILTKNGSVHFEEFLVRNGAKDEVLGVDFVGAEIAQPAAGVVDDILESELVVICPSNPIASIGAILSVKGVKEALKRTRGRVVAVSPIVAGAPIKGPADKLMKGLGLDVSAFSVAKLYADFLDLFVLDLADEAEREKIEDLGVDVKIVNTLMRSLENKVSLAKAVVES